MLFIQVLDMAKFRIAKHKLSKHLKHRQEITWRKKTKQNSKGQTTISVISRKAALEITVFHHMMV